MHLATPLISTLSLLGLVGLVVAAPSTDHTQTQTAAQRSKRGETCWVDVEMDPGDSTDYVYDVSVYDARSMVGRREGVEVSATRWFAVDAGFDHLVEVRAGAYPFIRIGSKEMDTQDSDACQPVDDRDGSSTMWECAFAC